MEHAIDRLLQNVNITQVLQAFSHMNDFMMSNMSLKPMEFQWFRHFKNVYKTQRISILLIIISNMRIKPNDFHYFGSMRSIEFFDMSILRRFYTLFQPSMLGDDCMISNMSIKPKEFQYFWSMRSIEFFKMSILHRFYKLFQPSMICDDCMISKM